MNNKDGWDLDYNWAGQPSWSAVRRATLGYGVLDIQNDTLIWEVKHPNGTLIDSFTVYKN